MEAKEMVLMQTRDGKVREREKGLSCKDGKVDNMVRGTLMFSRHVAKLSTNVTDGHTTITHRHKSCCQLRDANLPLPNINLLVDRLDPHEVEAELISGMHTYVRTLHAYL